LDKFFWIKKTPQVKTVVNKLDSIENTFRTFKMELLAGEDNFNVEVNESDCLFQFNFKEVYWNSRLQMEHNRLVNLIPKGSIVCDMFGGVGPFAIPCAKNRSCIVFANDLNPKSFESLIQNSKLNKVEEKVKSYNLDARDFVRKLINENIFFEHVIMNLPASAIDFLDVFKGLCCEKQKFYNPEEEKQRIQLEKKERKENKEKIIQKTNPMVEPNSNNNNNDINNDNNNQIKNDGKQEIGEIKEQKKEKKTINPKAINTFCLPIIHCYGFSNAVDPIEDILNQVEKVLGISVKSEANVHLVRDVSPKKLMLCVSFHLPPSVAFLLQNSKNNKNNNYISNSEEPPGKKQKMED